VRNWSVPGLTWAVVIVGVLLLAAIWVLVVKLGDGVAEPWRWSTGSWQAVATGATGFALVVFASVQVGVLRRMWLYEQNRLLVQRKQDILNVLLEAQFAVDRRVDELRDMEATRRLETPSLSVADIEGVIANFELVREGIVKLRGNVNQLVELSAVGLEGLYGSAVALRLQASSLDAGMPAAYR